ncbi:MAG: hypothetical protein ACR2MB_16665, partial [Acidimicrobiales bacterium]
MEQGKRQGAVPAQDRPTQRAEGSTARRPGVGLGGRKGRVLSIRWAAATEVTHDRPERIATFRQPAQGCDPTSCELVDLGVDLGQVVAELVASDLESDPTLSGC